MNQEKEYYTPDIAEFCLGFEYEVLDSADVHGERFWESKEWDGYDIEDLKFDLEQKKEIRVKLLDRADIEAEGWGYFEGNENYMRFKKMVNFPDNYPKRILNYWKNTPFIHIDKRDSHDQEEFVVLFHGAIRNRTEFRKVLKMIEL